MAETPRKHTIRLLFLCNSPANPAGAEKTVFLLFRHLDPNRFQSRFILNSEGPFAEQLRDAGADIEVIQAKGRLDRFWRCGLRTSLAEQPADVVQLQLSRLNAPLLRTYGCKIVERLNMTRHGGAWYPMRWRWLDRFTARWIDHFIVVSKSLEKDFASRGYKPEKMSVVYNGISPDIPASGDIRKELGLAKCTPLVGAVGRLTPQKGMDTFVQAAQKIHISFPDVHFLIAGEGEEHSNLKRIATHGGIGSCCHFLGHRADVQALLQELTVLLYPSRWEPFANTLLEAMVAGTPVIASEVGGNAEAISHGENGFLVPAESPEPAANACCQLLSDPFLREKFSKKQREKAKIFSLDKMVQDHQRVFEKIAWNHSG